MPQFGPAKIRCVSCGFSSEAEVQKCPLCGAAVVKVCGQCGASNPSVNQICDGCRRPLEMSGGASRHSSSFANFTVPQPPGAQQLPPGLRPPPPPAGVFGGAAQLAPGQTQSFSSNSGQPIEPMPEPAKPAAPAAPPLSDLLRGMADFFARQEGGRYFVYGVSSVLLVALLLALFWPKPPEVVLIERVKVFVENAGSGKYAGAYALLTEAVRKDASEDVFASAVKEHYPEKRIFRGFSVEKMEEALGVVKYMYKAGNGPWRSEKAYMFKEKGKWRRPFAEHLYPPLEAALKSDAGQALPLLDKMKILDPFDAKINGYACRTFFGTHDYKKAVPACAAAVQDSVTTPFLYSDSLSLSLRFMLAEAYMNEWQTVDALREYSGILIETQNIAAEDSCRVSRQLVQGYVKIGNYDAALNEAVSAEQPCAQAGRSKDIEEYLHKLSGNFPDDALVIARAFTPENSKLSLEQMWEQRRVQLRQENRLKRLPQGVWSAERVAGPHYRVRLVSEGIKGAPQVVRFDLLVNIISGRVGNFPVPTPEKEENGGNES